ncbi:MAG: glycosyltransferase family 2 protein [Streptococcus sp.]|jgi:glycosyltransferase|nr:glycosyltransferase family 2 protein [Streptococcus sp.]
MKVSIIITARNEEKYLPMLFEDILNQTYPLQNIEVVLMDSNSTDNTRKLMEEFKNNNESLSVQIVTNERQIQAAGFNEGVKHATGDVVLKIDAHSRIPQDFVQKNVNEIIAGAFVCGGNRPTVVDSDDDFSKTLHIVEESALGSSIANYRKSNVKRKVNSIFHGMYRKEVFEKVGLADERLLRTEDNEFHYRVRKAGYDIIFNPEIESYQYIRPTFTKMIQQKFANGYWIGLTSHICRDCLSLFHFGPGVFVATLLILMMFTPISFIPLLTVFGLYILAVLGLSIFEISKQKYNHTLLLIPFIMIAVHFAYGIGTIKGWIFGFEFKKEYFGEEEKS